MLLLLSGTAICSLTMLGAYFLCRARNNYSFVDIVWCLNFPLLAIVFATFGGGSSTRKGIVILLVCVEFFRLAYHLEKRIRDSLPHEDPRYRDLRKKWKGSTERNFLVLFLTQGLSNVAVSVPLLLVMSNSAVRLHWAELAGFFVAALSIAGEWRADFELRRFRSKTDQRSKVLKKGLWRYSRHPNYFFQFLMWCGFAIAALPATGGWLGLLSPALILYSLLRVTGVPQIESQLLKTRGDEYRAYQKSTPPLFPRFKR